MKKGWRYRLICGFSALVIAGAGAVAVYADEENPAQTQEALPEESGAEENVSNIEDQIDAYFDGTVFVGDSVMMGFRNYAMRRGGPCLGRMQFLASGSFSVHNALWPVNSQSVHPIYQGKQRPVWESLGMLQAKRVFMFFGLNDMNMGSLEDVCNCYTQVIGNIKTTCPEAEIHIMSMTYTKQGRGKGRLNNPNIRQFNEMLKQMASANGWGFVDIANPLADANGDLAAAYCSDNYVHQTNAAYDVWTMVLRDYARSQIDGTSAFPATGQKRQEGEAEEAAEAQGAAEAQEGNADAKTSDSSVSDTEASETSPVVSPQNTADQSGPGATKVSDETETDAGEENT